MEWFARRIFEGDDDEDENSFFGNEEGDVEFSSAPIALMYSSIAQYEAAQVPSVQFVQGMMFQCVADWSPISCEALIRRWAGLPYAFRDLVFNIHVPLVITVIRCLLVTDKFDSVFSS